MKSRKGVYFSLLGKCMGENFMYTDGNEERDNFASDLLGYLPTGIGIFDLTGNVVEARYISDGYYQMIGEKRDERIQFMGVHTLNAAHPDDRARLVAEGKAAIQEKRMADCRMRIRTSDGYLWIGLRANHVPINANTERFYAVYYNIQDYVRTEEAKSVLDNILGNIPTGVALFSGGNSRAHLEYANASFYKLHRGGKEYWSLQSENSIDWVIEQDREMFLKEFNAVSSGQKEESSITYHIIGGDGKPHWINILFRCAYEKNKQQYFYATFTDMDALKNAEAARDESRLLHEAAVTEAKLVVWEYDILKHRIIMADNEFTHHDYRKFGLPKVVDNAPQSLLPYIDDAYVDTFLEMYHKVEAGAPSADCYVWYKLQHGVEPRYMHISYRTVFDAKGRAVKAYGIGQNLTSQKIAQDAYKRLQQQLASNIKVSVGSFRVNLSKDLYLDGYSPYQTVLKALHTKTADEHFAATAATVLNEELRQKILQEYNCSHLLQLFKDGTKQLAIEYPTGTSYGGIVWIHTIFYMVQNPSTGDIEGISYSTDITEQKRNQEIIRRMTGTSCDYVGVIDTVNNTFDLRYGAWVDLGGIERKKFAYNEVRLRLATRHIDTADRQTFMDATEIDVLIKALLEKPQHVVTYKFYNKPADKERLRKQIVYYWLNDDKKEILVVEQDVTEVHRLEQARIAELEKAKKAAEAANVAKSEFLSRMSHDIRTPINGILGMTYLTQEMDIPQEAKNNLAKIDVSSKFLLSLINDVLDMAKAESGKIELHPEPYPVAEFRAYIDSVIKPLLERRNQTFTFEIAASVDNMIPLVDRLRINQVVFNLLSNASKYTPEGGKVIYRIQEKLLPNNRLHLHLDVIDNGIGMSKKFQKIVFEPFSQENRKFKTEMHGSGLGMAIVKKLMDAMHGTIMVKSSLGVGTAFSIDLDVDCVPVGTVKAEQMTQAAGVDDSGTILKGKHILLCEDHPLNQQIVRQLLVKKGMLIDIADDGQLGLEKFKSSSVAYYGVILMDIRMPVLDGYSATKAIRSLSRPDAGTVHIIGLSANAFREDIEKAKDSGMNDYLAKPIEPQKLYETLARYLK